MSTKLFEISTLDTPAIKTMFEGLKEVLNDINMDITRSDECNKAYEQKRKVKGIESEQNEDVSEADDTKKSGNIKEEGGIKIVATDPSKTLLINIKLDAKNFTEFYCRKKSIDLGINLGQFHKLIKSLDKEDSISLFVNEDDRQNLIIKVTNPEKNYDTLNKLKLMEINKTQYNIPPIAFDATITFNTAEFHRICREMNQIADHIEFKCTKKTITFSCKGDCSEKSTNYYADPDSSSSPDSGNGIKIRFGENSPDIVQGIFELKNLVMFSKYSSICDNIQIFMKNNYPLCIKYTIATLGRMLFCLTPIKEEDITENFSDEDVDYVEDKIKYIST